VPETNFTAWARVLASSRVAGLSFQFPAMKYLRSPPLSLSVAAEIPRSNGHGAGGDTQPIRSAQRHGTALWHHRPGKGGRRGTGQYRVGATLDFRGGKGSSAGEISELALFLSSLFLLKRTGVVRGAPHNLPPEFETAPRPTLRKWLGQGDGLPPAAASDPDSEAASRAPPRTSRVYIFQVSKKVARAYEFLLPTVRKTGSS
jgi:hypothetical protein